MSLEDALASQLMMLNITPGDVYHHYQYPGHLYKVLGFCILDYTGESMIVYQAMSGYKVTWTMKLSDWNSKIVVNGVEVPKYIKHNKRTLIRLLA